MAHQLNATPAINAFLDKALPKEHPVRAEAIRQGACRVCLEKDRPNCLSSECPTGPRCHYREMANQRFAILNPDTHCRQCYEPLSIYGHCWQCHWPPMDPAQDAITQTTTVGAKPHHIPCGNCGACYANEPCGLLQPQAIATK